MHALREFVFDAGIRCHLAAALSASPSFSGAQEFSADALAAPMFLDKPTFHITDRAREVAAVSTRAKASFEKSDEGAVGSLRDEND